MIEGSFVFTSKIIKTFLLLPPPSQLPLSPLLPFAAMVRLLHSCRDIAGFMTTGGKV